MIKATIGAAAWLLCAFVVGMCMPACSRYAAAWKTTEAVKTAATVATEAITKRARDKHAACKKLHKPKTPELAKCVEPEYGQAKRFRAYAVPAINAGIRVTVAAITIAEKNKAKGAWIDLVKPAVCALASVTKEFESFLPDKAKAAIMAVVALAKGVTCDR